MFNAKLYPHSLLKAGEVVVPAIISIRNDGSVSVGTETGAVLVFVLIIDCSGSMGGPKIVAAREAGLKIVSLLPDTAYVAVIAGGGHNETKTVLPLTRADASGKAQAALQIGSLTANWNTHISGWIDAADVEFAKLPHGIKRGLLLTDGQNQENDKNVAAHRSAARCKGRFQLDCRGVGDDWDVPLLTHISRELLGDVDVIKKPEDMASEFQAVLTAAAAKSLSDVRVRLTCPPGTTVEYFKQMAPTMMDLSKQGTVVPSATPGTTIDFPTGAWAREETRDYQVAMRLARAGTAGGPRMLAGRVGVVVRQNGQEEVLKLEGSNIAVGWTANEQQSVLAIPPELTRYGKEGALVQRMQAAIAAKAANDVVTATKLLNEASELAEQVGNEGTKKLIRDVAVVDERTKRVVGLRQDANAADWIAAGTRSVRTKVLDSSNK